MRRPPRNEGGLRGWEWGVIGLGFLLTLVLAVVAALIIPTVDQFPFTRPFRNGEILVYDGNEMHFESRMPVRCIGDLCDVVNVTEKNEDMCLVVVWTKEGKEGFLVAPRPCSTGVDVGDLGDVDTGGAEPGQCLCTPDGEEFVPGGPFQLLAEKGQPDGYCPLNLASLVPDIHLPPELMRIRGCWNANTNTPLLMSGGCPLGDFYVVAVAGSTMLDGTNDWIVGDGLVCVQGTFWKRVRAELEVGDLVDADTTGQMNGDVLRRIGGTWVPDGDCCAQPPGGQVGFFAAHDTGQQDLGENTWTRVDFVLQNSFFLADVVQTGVGAGQPGFNNAGNVYRIPASGWYSIHSTGIFDVGQINEHGQRGFRLFLFNSFVSGVVAIAYEVYDGFSGAGPPGGQFANRQILEVDGVFPFCIGDNLIMQGLVDHEDDSDAGFDLNESAFLGADMTWSMWRIPDALMPPWDAGSCQPPVRRRGKRLVGPGYDEPPEHTPAEPVDPATAYHSAMRDWLYRKQMRDRCSNCSLIDVGPRPVAP